ncbi:hypothetical protein SAMN05216228_1012192 [Rhizobium tibeticum]|uniref:Uncharacterized protein n=2 Tax=Rhizobium tibeticum TaxID=501024 RepID=A0A1H8MIC4_9HYPH|nr:hypothetical protein RTCCBAU85039_3053 [Rhizobium tibeticum]SEO17033.1 hypothetical protein SAMN05216228_1012192 [Rhizobium tibeticum]
MIRMFILALPALLLSEAVRANMLPLSKINRKIESHIQRSNTKKNVRCLAFILKDFQERKIPKSRILVTFDDPNIDGIGIGLDETDENYTCEAGELRSWEANKYQVAKTF